MTDHQEGLWFIDPANVLPPPDVAPQTLANVTIRGIQEQVCREYGITMPEMLGPSRAKKYAFPRMVAMQMCVLQNKWSLTQIGDRFNRDHTTVMHAVKTLTADHDYLQRQYEKKARWVCKRRTNMVQLSVG